MRCRICNKTTKYAGQIARKRRICGNCWYSVKTMLNYINMPIPLKSHAR